MKRQDDEDHGEECGDDLVKCKVARGQCVEREESTDERVRDRAVVTPLLLVGDAVGSSDGQCQQRDPDRSGRQRKKQANNCPEVQKDLELNQSLGLVGVEVDPLLWHGSSLAQVER